MIAVTITHGKNAPIIPIPVANIAHENPIKIFNKAWPAIILANNRILKLKTFAMYDTSSIKTKNGEINRGTPLGRNMLKKCHPFLYQAIIFNPIKCVAARKNVTTKLLVSVKL